MTFLRDKIRDLVENAVSKKFGEKLKVKIEYPTQEAHGDYATAVPFAIGKTIKKNPKEVAAILNNALELPDWIEKSEIAGTGFINFFLSPKFLTENLGANFAQIDIGKGKTIVTDTSHPNVAKPMGVHHILSTIIGNSLNRILAAIGYRVIRDNYLGDWGTQFGKLIYAYKQWGNTDAVQKNPIPELLKLYVKFHDESEKNSELEDRGREEFKKLEERDVENRKLWQWVVDLSLKEFHAIYQRLDVEFDVINGESFYEAKMKPILELGAKKKVFVQGERGALICEFPEEGYTPAIVQKADGATLYATRDLARIKYWEDTWHPDLMVNVVDMAQTLYFKQLFAMTAKLGLTAAQNIHVTFGRMRFPEKRMSTRKGNIVLLEDLLDEAEDGAYAIVNEKNPDLSEERKRKVARQVGIGAVKYAVLSQNRITDVTFTWEKMLSLNGNSAPYVQYAYARGKSILRKSATARSAVKSNYILKESHELDVARLLPKFQEIIADTAEDFKPNLLTNYLFELATKFNAFYGALPVLKAPAEIASMRLLLVEAATKVLKNGLDLLGIEAPEEM